MPDQSEFIVVNILHKCGHVDSHEFDINSPQLGAELAYASDHLCNSCEDVAMERKSDYM